MNAQDAMIVSVPSLEQRQRFQQLFFPDGISFDGNSFVRTALTAPAFSYLRQIETENEGLVDLTGIEPVNAIQNDARNPLRAQLVSSFGQELAPIIAGGRHLSTRTEPVFLGTRDGAGRRRRFRLAPPGRAPRL